MPFTRCAICQSHLAPFPTWLMTTSPFPLVSCWWYFSEAFGKHLQTLPVFSFFFFKAAIKVLYCTLKHSHRPGNLMVFTMLAPFPGAPRQCLAFHFLAPYPTSAILMPSFIRRPAVVNCSKALPTHVHAWAQVCVCTRTQTHTSPHCMCTCE